MPPSPIIQVAVPGPLARLFDYLPPASGEAPPLGTRVRVPFGRGHRIGIVAGRSDTASVERRRLKPIESVLDVEPILPGPLLALAEWAAAYYHHPPGEVLAAILPAPLRRGETPPPTAPARWRITASGREAMASGLRGAPARARLLALLDAADGSGLDSATLRTAVERYGPPLRALIDRGWVEAAPETRTQSARVDEPPVLNEAQRDAIDAIRAGEGFRAFLLEGITGSGKTEVYLAAIRDALSAGRQALVLVPEIGLTPQLLGRFAARLNTRIAVLHSGLADGERLDAWRQAASGAAGVVVGTRSAVFAPLATPGLIVVDEEHDPSLKQQDGFRYHARDLALLRARRAGIPIVLGSATPSLESLANVERGALTHLRLAERAGGAQPPKMELIDVRGHTLEAGLSAPLLELMQRHLDAGEQVLLFINRRGWAPTLICDACGEVEHCRRCDARMTLHQGRRRLCCHHCGAERPVPTRCSACGSASLAHLGQGTERVEAALGERFPGIECLRIDRDTTRRKGALDAKFERIRSGEARILLGTQMLAKGHDFPAVTLVGVLDADGGLYSADFRGPEHLAQTVLQVAGRAGRAERPGRVLIQTRNPEHPLLRMLVTSGYSAVAETLLEERRAASLPPITRMALVRAESPKAEAPMDCLRAAAEQLAECEIPELTVSGPAPAPMERLAGRYRAHLVLEAPRRAPLHAALDALRPWLETAKPARRVRWSIDVDPIDMR